MPMIALSPVRWSWQKTTCSCPACSNWARPAGCVSGAAPFSWGIANTLVTVATLLIPFRFLVEPRSEPAYCVRGVAAGGARQTGPAVPGEPVRECQADRSGSARQTGPGAPGEPVRGYLEGRDEARCVPY